MAFNRLIRRPGRSTFSMFGDGEQTRDFTFVADTVRGTVAAAERGAPGTAYNIGGGSRRSMNSVLHVLGDLLGAAVECRRVLRQGGDARDTAADIERARGELGFEPSGDFAGTRRTARVAARGNGCTSRRVPSAVRAALRLGRCAGADRARREERLDVVFYMPGMGSMLSSSEAVPPGGAETQVLMLSKALA